MLNDELKKLRNQTIALRQEADHLTWIEGVGIYEYTSQVLRTLDSFEAMRRMCWRTEDVFDALGIWTGADDLLWDRLIYLLTVFDNYCDPAKAKAVVDAVQAQWAEKGTESR